MNDIVYAGKHSLTYDVTRHQHASWELVYCTGGSGVFHFEDQNIAYGEDDIVVIPPGIPHTNDSEGGFTNIHLNLVNPILSASAPFLVRDDSNGFIRSAFSAAFFHYSDSPSRNAVILSAYGDLIAAYMAAFQQDTPNSSIVVEIENHIIKNFPDPNFELDTYLRSFPFNYDYLRKLFKKELGVTPHKYLMDKRLETAAKTLTSDYLCGNNVTEIAHLCGFREPLYFSRMFKKKYGVSPSLFSTSFKAKTPEDIRVTLSEDE